jgi:hypothetical protein
LKDAASQSPEGPDEISNLSQDFSALYPEQLHKSQTYVDRSCPEKSEFHGFDDLYTELFQRTWTLVGFSSGITSQYREGIGLIGL